MAMSEWEQQERDKMVWTNAFKHQVGLMGREAFLAAVYPFLSRYRDLIEPGHPVLELMDKYEADQKQQAKE